MPLTRREFVAAASAAPALLGAEQSAAPAGKPWYATMRRCGQINFNERDPLNLDVRAWTDYWASLKVNAVLMSGGGIVAFYPSEIPYHHRSEFLGSRDLFGEMAAEVKRRGMRVVARMDCNYAYGDALQARPQWFERNRDGSSRPHNESPQLYKTCMFSSYFSEQMPAIYREIAARYPVDGFFTNGWPGTGALTVCHCENCQKVYRDRVGGVPPDRTDGGNPLYRKYYAVYMERVLDIWKQRDSTVREKNPESVYVGNLGGGIRTVKNVKALGEVAGWFNADHQGRAGDTVIWNCAQQGRVAYSVMKGRTVTNVTGAYSNSRITWRHTAKPAAETTMWMAQTAASGMVPWFHWLGGSPEDNRWRETGRSFFAWLAQHEEHFRNRTSIADLAVLYPQSTIAFGRAAGTTQITDHLDGMYQALLEGRFVFDLVHQEDLSSATLGKYRALLLPNAAYLRDSECQQIHRYVAGGGSLLATFETSRYNEWGDRRGDLALADVLGASIAGESGGGLRLEGAGDTIGPHGNSYLRVERDHAVLRGLEGTALLPGAEYRVPIRAHESSPPLFTVVPYYPAFPPEMVFPRQPHTDQPGAVFRQQGDSRIAYFPGDIEATSWRSGSADLSLLLQNTVRWLLGNRRQPVAVSGQGIVEVFAWETEPGYAVHLLNYTNPHMTRGLMRSFFTVGPQQVEVHISGGRKIRSARALRAAKTLPFRQDGATVSLTVPSVTDYEVIALT